MTISIRLDTQTEGELRRQLDALEVSLSDFVRDAIREKLARYDPAETPFSIGEPLFGRYTSGDGDRSTRRKEILREKLHDRHRR